MSRGPIRWKVSFNSAPERVYQALSTEEGRLSFWAEEAAERDGAIVFRFANGWRETSTIKQAIPHTLFEIVYFGALTRFEIEAAEAGAVLTLTAEGVPDRDWDEVHAGWVSALLSMKAAIDFEIDLRNHSATRTWEAGFVDV
ncbi:MAG: SRPBCC domain-containing protein [Hyphomonadaceae bacterium]